VDVQTPDELKSALRNAQKATEPKPYCFAVVLKGSDGILLVDKRKVAPAMLDAAKKKIGSTSVVRGRCYGGEGTLVFETAKPVGGTVASVVRKLMQTQAGVSFKPEFIVGRGDEELEGEEGATEETGSAAPNPKTLYDDLLARVLPLVRAARDTQPAAVAKAAPVLQLAGEKAKAGDYRAAVQSLQGVKAMFEKGSAGIAAAMETWKTRRAAVTTSLRSTAAKIASAKHPNSAKAIMEIQSVVKNLTAEPSSLQQVAELQSWLGTDAVVNDVCELVEDIRTPLNAALDELRSRLTA
jgi:hypothetical protein